MKTTKWIKHFTDSQDALEKKRHDKAQKAVSTRTKNSLRMIGMKGSEYGIGYLVDGYIVVCLKAGDDIGPESPFYEVLPQLKTRQYSTFDFSGDDMYWVVVKNKKREWADSFGLAVIYNRYLDREQLRRSFRDAITSCENRQWRV